VKKHLFIVFAIVLVLIFFSARKYVIYKSYIQLSNSIKFDGKISLFYRKYLSLPKTKEEYERFIFVKEKDRFD
jgi:hypothetical protein